MDSEYAVLLRYGLEKHAMAVMPQGLGALVGNALFRQHNPEKWRHVPLEFLREGVFGSPLTLYDSVKKLHQESESLPKALWQHARNFYWHPPPEEGSKALSLSPLDKPPAGGGNALNALNLALSGYDLYSAVAHGKENRFGDLAAGVTGLALNPFTGHLGLAGMPIHAYLQNAARSVGHRFDPETPDLARPYAQPLAPGPHVRRVLRSMNMPIPQTDSALPDMG